MKAPCKSFGRGPAHVVFLHGFTGSRSSFDHLEPFLEHHLTATCLDLPGHGENPWEPESFESVIEHVAEALPTRCTVVGYSQGARIALAVAARHPSKVERLVLESGSPGLRQRRARSLRRRADELLAKSLESEGVEAFVARWEQRSLFAGLRSLPAAVQERIRSTRTSHSVQGLAAALRVMGQGTQPDLWPDLPTLRVPTLLMSGERDVKYTRLAGRMATELPLAWRVVFRGVGHAPHLETPQLYAQEVINFLAASWTHEPEVESTR